MQIRRADERGCSELDWLQSWHTFSFSQYYDPDFMGFGVLRVINEDKVVAGGGFNTHAHDNMEILTYVLEGELEHKDSMGNGSVIRPGDVQRMSAGTGVTHSEFNHSQTQPVHFLQIWVLPNAQDIAPGYEQKHIDCSKKQGQWCLLASASGREGSVLLHQDIDIHAICLEKEQEASFALAVDQQAWAHVARGQVALNDAPLHAGDGASLTGEERLRLSHAENAEVLLFVMPIVV